jgi:DNA/RNA endonuclease YhcR with UshA esterase domain
MNDKLLYVAIITSISGLMLLTYAGSVLEPGLVEIGGIDNGYLYKNVHVRGEVTDLKKFNTGSILLTISDKTGSISVFIYCTDAEKLNIGDVSEGKRVDVTGTVELYEDELEIKLNDYRHINPL